MPIAQDPHVWKSFIQVLQLLEHIPQTPLIFEYPDAQVSQTLNDAEQVAHELSQYPHWLLIRTFPLEQEVQYVEFSVQVLQELSQRIHLFEYKLYGELHDMQ